MHNLFMLPGLGAVQGLLRGERNALYQTLEEFHTHWDRIDMIAPARVRGELILFGNTHVHGISGTLVLYPFRFISATLRLFRKRKFNLMTVHEFPPFYNGIAARILRRITGVPYVLEIMHIPGYPKAATAKEWLYCRWMRVAARWDARPASMVRVINRRETPEFLKKAGVSADKIRYIPALYIDRDVFCARDEAKRYDLMFAGRWEHNKGLGLFLDALTVSDLTGVIVGAGPLGPWLAGHIRRRGLGNRVTIHGWAENSRETARLMNQSRILVMPSFNEGGPRVVLEAMACGVPVLATSVGSVPDILQDGVSGDIIPWNGRTIARKAEALLSDPERYARYRSAGLEIAAAFERHSAVKAYADALKEYCA